MEEWFLRATGENPNDPSSYISVGSTPPACPGAGKICAIFAELNGNGEPIFTEQIQGQMITALSTGLDQPLVILRSSN